MEAGNDDDTRLSSSSDDRSRPNSAPQQQQQIIKKPLLRAIHTAPSTTSNNIKINGSNNDQQMNNVRVVARLRPLSTKELTEQNNSTGVESIVAHSSSSTIRIPQAKRDSSSHGGGSNNDKRTFKFDAVFPPSSSQIDVYNETCKDMISNSIFKGYNATILAYGQTGSGKVCIIY